MTKKIAGGMVTGLFILSLFSFGRAPQKLPDGKISISGAWALYPMVLKWAEEFKKLRPEIKIDIQAGGAGKGMADVLSGMADLGMVSREVNPEELKRGAFPIAVTRDAVVATASEKNPLAREIREKGITRQQFTDIWITGKVTSWGQVIGKQDNLTVHIYTRSDACGAADTWAAFLGKKQEDLGGIGVYGDPGLADAVARDPLGIGYNNVNFAFDAKTLKPVAGIVIIPIDIDGNGKIEGPENCYATRDDITAAIAKNIYPSPPARDLYLVGKGKPANAFAVEFMRWILTEGQKFVPETGYIRLSDGKLKEGLEKIK